MRLEKQERKKGNKRELRKTVWDEKKGKQQHQKKYEKI